MKRLLVPAIAALFAALMTSGSASAQYPAPFGFLPFGFYQPYGARYDTGIRTPPYFATNPPVYYGARHARPYGLSPFASPPMVSAAENYESRLRTQFEQPVIPTPQPMCNPCVSQSSRVKPQAKPGLVRTNPFVESEDLIAKN